MTDLLRTVFVCKTAAAVGATTLSVAQILGASDRNNRRDHLTSIMLFHAGQVLQAVEGQRGDLDRLLTRLREDGRIQTLKVLATTPIPHRRFAAPAALCGLSDASVARRLDGRALDDLTAAEAEDMLASCIVAPAEAA
ncbi:MAG TPA: BLUF domain-containing protein [Brevundimonas sp.]|uniref:BLUF domain-containing protein n=1 Tax=Brevundimonas sp. TaxID=1871086 RepID=UPI002611F81D|nr:BLUF domain-containing protein [Brevundimonas sp.]HRO32813.1 BLUF domain-containing protein [Brevundimonas sp.]